MKQASHRISASDLLVKMTSSSEVYVITGANRGLGFEFAKQAWILLFRIFCGTTSKSGAIGSKDMCCCSTVKRTSCVCSSWRPETQS